jgi:hypothetical protein
MFGAGAKICEKLEPEPHKNLPAPRHFKKVLNVLVPVPEVIFKFTLSGMTF